MKKRRAALLSGLSATLLLTVAVIAPSASAAGPTGTLVWSDDFTGPAGQSPDAAWVPQLGGGGWGNNELESYTARPQNVSLDGAGDLVITARKERYVGSDGIRRNYTSARIMTSQSFQYGWIEARIKVPAGQGLWPAFWLLGANVNTVGWPACGEIDAMESINSMTTVYGTVHGATVSGAHWQRGTSTPMTGTAWHTYAVSWTATRVTWYIDGTAYGYVDKSQLSADQVWSFDNPQKLILNLAVGGNWPGSPDRTTPLPASMVIDYVRVYSS
jgi:beta-glucanase (GH16 family)